MIDFIEYQMSGDLPYKSDKYVISQLKINQKHV